MRRRLAATRAGDAASLTRSCALAGSIGLHLMALAVWLAMPQSPRLQRHDGAPTMMVELFAPSVETAVADDASRQPDAAAMVTEAAPPQSAPDHTEPLQSASLQPEPAQPEPPRAEGSQVETPPASPAAVPVAAALPEPPALAETPITEAAVATAIGPPMTPAMTERQTVAEPTRPPTAVTAPTPAKPLRPAAPRPSPAPAGKLQPPASPAGASRPMQASFPSDAAPPMMASPAEPGPAQIITPRYRLPPVAPVYPRIARELGQQGEVVVRALLDRQGNPAEVLVQRSSGFDVLDRAALAAVRHWAFDPGRRGTETVTAWVQVPVRFTLQ